MEFSNENPELIRNIVFSDNAIFYLKGAAKIAIIRPLKIRIG